MATSSYLGSFETHFRGNRAEIIELLDVEHGLLPELKDRNVLSDLHVQDIESVSDTWIFMNYFVVVMR